MHIEISQQLNTSYYTVHISDNNDILICKDKTLKECSTIISSYLSNTECIDKINRYKCIDGKSVSNKCNS